MDYRQHSHSMASTSNTVTCRGIAAHPVPRRPFAAPPPAPGTLQRLRPCNVTHTADEYDHLREKKKNTFLIDQTPIPNPELGPLERRVSLTYLEALSDDNVRQEDIDYWFNEPEGGWNRPALELPFAEEVDVGEPTTGAHPGEGRTPIECFKVGDIIEGQVSAAMYLYGVLVDFGADFDGLVPITERQWTDELNELLDVGAPVKARVYAIRDTEWFRFPVQLEILEPAVGATLDPPEDHVPALDLRNKPQDFDLYLEKSQRPYIRRKYWVDTEKDDMNFLQQFDEDRTDERLLNQDTNWLASSDTLQRMSAEAWGELQDAGIFDE